MTRKCDCCGRAWPKPRMAKALLPDVDRASMSDKELFAHLKKIAVRDDARFFLTHAPALPDALRVEAEALLAELLTRPSKPADTKRLNAVKDRARALRPWPVVVPAVAAIAA